MAPSANNSNAVALREPTTSHNTKGACLFTDKLPLDIRLEIYRHLLGRYTKSEQNMKSREYNQHRNSILNGPDHTYSFHTSVLGTNRQVRKEAMDLFEHENKFVFLADNSIQCDPYTNAGLKLREQGVTVLAQGHRARDFPNIGLSIDLDVDFRPRENTVDAQQERTVSVFPFEDLPAACVALQRKLEENRHSPRIVNIHITINPHLDSKLRGCLDTLRRVRGADRVQISGPVTPADRAATVAAMCGPRLSVNQTIFLAGVYFNRGDGLSSRGQLAQAIVAYKSALQTIRGRTFNYDECKEIVVGGRFDGCLAGWVRGDIEVRVHTLIANAYLQSGNSRLARIYVERIYGPLFTVDHRFNAMKFPLELTLDANPVVYAELLTSAAQISLLHGKIGEASAELHEASVLNPEEPEIERRYEQVQARLQARNSQWNAARDEKRKRAEAKVLAAIQTGNSRKSKGDEAYRRDNFVQAQQKYEAALVAVEGVFYCSDRSFNARLDILRLDILAKLTTICLELFEYDEVHHWAAKITAVESHFLHKLTVPCRVDQVAYAREAYYMAYYNKAVAFEKEGKIRAAIHNFKNALLACDHSCHASYYQLEILTQKMAERRKAHDELSYWGEGWLEDVKED